MKQRPRDDQAPAVLDAIIEAITVDAHGSSGRSGRRSRTRAPGILMEEYWGEPGERIEDWAQPIIARGPRQAFEMEQVRPGADPGDPDPDPITEANELKDGGDPRNAHKILMKFCEADLRCLEAHVHLGN